MLKKHNKILHYLLIFVLMVAPVRGLLAASHTALKAAPQAPCHMNGMNSDMSSDMRQDMSSHDMSGHDMSSHQMSDHDMSLHDSTSESVAHDIVIPDPDRQQGVNNKCCCCDDDCNSQCDMGLSAALILQVSGYKPVFVNAENSIGVSPRVLVRALTPPSRPPAQLS